MSISRGPSRIILLRSGVYDYAELDLHVPLHLVAANNVGKTSLISVLQFLYIDDTRQMHFSHEWKDTKRHYFPDNGSFVLFECMTPTGFQVFGLRGLGPVQGYEFERFAYTGHYRREDYLDERTPRPWEEINRALMARDLRKLEPKHLRASLTSSGDSRDAPLGLVPLKRSGSYESFRFLFNNLLRLSRIEQNLLKQLFIDICQPRLRQTEIDLRSQYADLFGKVDRQAREVEALRFVAPKISDLVEKYAARDDARRRLVAMWQAIESALTEERTRAEDNLVTLTDKRRALEQERRERSAEQATTLDQVKELSARCALLKRDIQELEQLRDKTRDFIDTLEEATRARLQIDYDDLVARLSRASQANRADIEGRLNRLRRAIDEDQRLVDRYGDALVTWLRTRTGLGDDALADIFQLVDPPLLGEVVREGRVSIEDEGRVIELVHGLHDFVDADGLQAPGLRIARWETTRPSPLAPYQDVEAVRARLESQRTDETELQKTLIDLEDRDRLLDERLRLDQQRRAAEERLKDWQRLTERAPELALLQQKHSVLVEELAANDAIVDALQQTITALALEQDGLGDWCLIGSFDT